MSAHSLLGVLNLHFPAIIIAPFHPFSLRVGRMQLQSRLLKLFVLLTHKDAIMSVNRFIQIAGLVGLLLSGGWLNSRQTVRAAEEQSQRQVSVQVVPASQATVTVQSAGYMPKTLEFSSSPSQERTRNVFGRDDRISMTASSYPWSTIGRVEVPQSDRTIAICTGTLIARDLVVTNAHCVFDQQGNPHTAMFFAPNLIQNQTSVRASVISAVVGTRQPQKQRAQDWAILKLNLPLGDQYGWMEWTSAPIATLEHLRQQFISVGYSGDFPRYRGGSTAGVHLGCSIRGYASTVGLATHDCDMTRGASGGPIFYLSEQGMGRIVALNTAERINPQGEYPTRFSFETANYAVVTRQWANAAIALRSQSRREKHDR